jgi:hypothetical protein
MRLRDSEVLGHAAAKKAIYHGDTEVTEVTERAVPLNPPGSPCLRGFICALRAPFLTVSLVNVLRIGILETRSLECGL